MDRLSEIRARCEAARPVVFVDVPIRAETRVFLEHAKSDMTYLLAEVERLTARAETAEAERDAIKDDFQDFATSGIYNMNPYCSNRCADCTDGRGWCIENRCKGFYVALPEPPKEGE